MSTKFKNGTRVYDKLAKCKCTVVRQTVDAGNTVVIRDSRGFEQIQFVSLLTVISK